jgi:TonB family protein
MKMKSFLAILVLAGTLSLKVKAQDVRSKVAPPSEKAAFTIVIDPDKSVFGAPWGSSEDEFVGRFGSPTGYIRLSGAETVMLYGKSHAFVFTDQKLSGVRITYTVIDFKLSRDQVARTPFDDIRWQLSNGVRNGMNLADVKKIAGDNLKTDRYQRYFNSDQAVVELDFAHFVKEGETDAAYKLNGIYIRWGASAAAQLSAARPSAAQPAAIQPAPVSARPRGGPIPEATRPCNAEVATWWQTVRTAAREIVDSEQRRRDFLNAWYQAHPAGPNFKSPPQKELDKLQAGLATAIGRYRQVLEEGRVKAYSIPVEDRERPVILHMGRPDYTDLARRDKINGTVSVRSELLADGTVGDVLVVAGLKDGLDEQAIKAVREIIFLPAVKDGMFVTKWTPVDMGFSIR